MTYCLGMLLDAGMVLIADTRTNAGVDNFSCYKKLHCLADSPDRQVFAASSGSLSVSQSVIALLEEGLPPEDKEDTPRSLYAVTSMFRAAQLVGRSEEHTSELQSLMRISYAVFCLKKKKKNTTK